MSLLGGPPSFNRSGRVTFDSSHFGGASSLTVLLTVTDSSGATATDTATLPAKNLAIVAVRDDWEDPFLVYVPDQDGAEGWTYDLPGDDQDLWGGILPDPRSRQAVFTT